MLFRKFFVILEILFVLIFIENKLKAQDSINANNTILKFAPLYLLDPIIPSIQFGAEYKINNRFSIQGELAYMFPEPYNFAKGWFLKDFRNRNGYKIKAEFRNYLKNKKKKKSNLYLAAEIFYIKNKYDRRDRFVQYDTINHTRIIYYGYDIIDKNIIGSCIKIGCQFIKNPVIDIYTGLGARYVKIKFLYENPDEECCPTMDLLRDYKGESLRPNFTIGLKIGYSLKEYKQKKPD